MLKGKNAGKNGKSSGTDTKEKSFERKDNSGALFINSKKEQENHPDLNGSVKINGKEYWISAWQKESGSGNEYYSLAFKEKE